MKTKETLKKEAIARQTASDALSVNDRLRKLDAKLGVGVGAVKERARLLSIVKAVA